MTLDQILDQTLELLQNPQFKNFGSLQKSKYQHSKPEEDRENRRLKFVNRIYDEEAIKQIRAKKRASKKPPTPEQIERRKKGYEKRRRNYYIKKAQILEEQSKNGNPQPVLNKD